MKKDYTHIVFLIDRSGSMSSIVDDMEGGIATFIDEQKQKPGICTITAARFDNEFELLFTRKPISDVKTIRIKPRGMTALIDSMARLINEVGIDLDSLSEDEKPERVLFVTITDGKENASLEFTNEKLKELIKEQEDKYSWNFTYIGANQDAFEVSSNFGGKMSNSLNYTATSDGVTKMFSKLSDATTRYRSESFTNLSSDTFQYTDEEQKDL
jgi:uncharacterized protein YegL